MKITCLGEPNPGATKVRNLLDLLLFLGERRHKTTSYETGYGAQVCVANAVQQDQLNHDAAHVTRGLDE